MNRMKNILLIGSGAREHAIAKAIKNSSEASNIFCFASNNNPAIRKICANFHIGDIQNTQAIINFALEHKPIIFAIIGPESSLANGAVDSLQKQGIPAIGPTKKLAQIETSKSFARNLLQGCAASFLPQYQIFNSMNGVKEFLQTLGNDFVVKADGLMSGKGVKVSGEHLLNHKEALDYCQKLVEKQYNFLIEEKFIGQEFSLLSFSDGYHLVHMPIVQDHKRAFNGDLGPNTGGMGSYSDTNHSLPFLNANDIKQAQALNQITVNTLTKNCGERYKGILYGSFILTENGIKLIEYNARFGDPEAINLLALLQSDFIAICTAIINGELNRISVDFTHKASVCKYLVPAGYPDNPKKHELIDVSAITDQNKLYYAAIDEIEGKLYTRSSRALAVLGVADNILKAEKIAEETAQKVTGQLFHRSDIGSLALINKKIRQINQLCQKNYPLY